MHASIAAPSKSFHEQMPPKPGFVGEAFARVVLARWSLVAAIPLILLQTAARPSPAAGGPLFGTPVPYELAPNSGAYDWTPHAVAIGDLNGDGKPDLVVPNYDPSAFDISVVLGNGDGTFGARADHGAGSANTSVAIADLNDDGRADVVTGDETGRVWVLLGRGDGTLLPASGISTSGHVTQVAVGDLNSDGRPDLVTPAGDVLLGNGDGTFRPAVRYNAEAYCVAIGDLNRDGKPDLVAPSFGGSGSFHAGSVGVLIGNGNGTLQEPRYYQLGWIGVTSVSIADLNADGKPDVVVGAFGSVSALLGDGSGGLLPPSSYITYSGSDVAAQGVAVGDLNGDGVPDIAVADGWGFYLGHRVFLGNGDGTFREDRIYGSLHTFSVAIGDLNGDGKPDLAGVGEVLLNVGPDPIRVDVELRPHELRLSSDREWISAKLELPRGYLASQVDVASIRLNSAVRAAATGPAERDRASLGRGGEIGRGSEFGRADRRELTVRFPWDQVRATLETGRHVPVTITGAVAGQWFRGTDWIRVEGGGRNDHSDCDEGEEGGGSGAVAGSVAHDTRAIAEAQPATGFALQPENPARGELRARFSLEGTEPATLEVFDVSGRRTNSREVGSGSPGWHTVRLGEADPGLYFIRLSQSGRSLTSRVAVIR